MIILFLLLHAVSWAWFYNSGDTDIGIAYALIAFVGFMKED